MNTYNVTLEVGNAVMTNEVQADYFETDADGASFVREREDHSDEEVAYYPVGQLIGIRLVPVTP
jgi:hypothetical protein